MRLINPDTLTGFNFPPPLVASLWGSLATFCCGLNIFGWSLGNFAADQLMWVTNRFYENPSKGWIGSDCILFSPQVRTQGSPYHHTAHMAVSGTCLWIFLYATDSLRSFTALNPYTTAAQWKAKDTVLFFFSQIYLNLVLNREKKIHFFSTKSECCSWKK